MVMYVCIQTSMYDLILVESNIPTKFQENWLIKEITKGANVPFSVPDNATKMG